MSTIDRIMRLAEVEKAVGLKKSAIYNRIDPKHKHYDPDFPIPIKLGSNASGWLESDVQAWIMKKAGRVAANDSHPQAA